MVLLKQMLILFVLMAVGVLCRKFKIMNDEVSKGMSSVVVNIASPAFIISAGINRDEYVDSDKLITCVILALVMYAFLIAISIFLPKLLRVEEKHVGTYRLMTIFSNIGFMGFPIVLATYGKLGLLYAAIFQFPYNLLIYTYGIQVIRGENASDKKESGFPLKKIINAGVISVFTSILLYLLRVRVPDSIQSIVESLSDLTVPLSMMVIGYALGGIKPKALVSDVQMLLFSMIKLIVIPCIGISLLSFLKDRTLLGVFFIMIATPVGSMTAMFAEAYDGDKETASKSVALTTLLSVVTIPLVGYIFRSIL